MKLLLAVVCACLVSVAWTEPCKEGELEKGCKPAYCGPNGCPKYWTVARRRGYHIRCYAPSTWAMTAAPNADSTTFTTEFLHLTGYFGKGNKEGVRIETAVPVLTVNKVNNSTHKTHSMVGQWFQRTCNTTVPTPTDPKVAVRTFDKFCVYIRSYGGYNIGHTSYMYGQLRELSKSVKRDRKSFTEGLFSVGWYNFPFQMINRHNEVWRYATEADTAQYMGMVNDPRIDETCEQK